jgi:CSLREA domain-containing protein
MKKSIAMRLRGPWFFRRIPKLLMLALIVILAALQLAAAATFSVDSTADMPDVSPGDGACATGNLNPLGEPECTLRAAIQESNALPRFPTPQVNLLARTYVLTEGRLQISNSLIITGRGADSTIIDGNKSSSIFLISNPGTNPGTNPIVVNISGVTIQNGDSGISNGAGIFISEGSSLRLANSVVRDNSSRVGGVGIANAGILTLFRSTVRDNRITGGGGGITGTGGGILNTKVAEIIESTISNNQGIRGGGIANSGSLDITNSTVSGNKASVGGGIRNFPSGVVNISFSTITDNEAGLVTGEPMQNRVGGGVANLGQVNIGNTILAGNRDGRTPSDALFSPDCFSVVAFSLTSFRGNLVGTINENCDLQDTISGAPPPFDMVGTEDNPLDPRLGPLANNGGPTRTHALLSDSPAIDQSRDGTSATFFDCLETDQRGLTRPVDGNRDGAADCDIGAFEFGAIPPKIVNNLMSLASKPVTSLSTAPTPDGPAGTFFVTAMFTNTSTIPIRRPFFQVIELSGGNVLLNADSGTGVGAILTPDVGPDRILAPGESVTAEFRIGLQTLSPFTFFVDVMAEPIQ